MWLPRLMRAADEQEQAMGWARVDRLMHTDPAPHHRQFGTCRCNLPRRHVHNRTARQALFGTDFERSTAILHEVRNGWRLAFFKWLAIVLLVVLLVFIGLTSGVNGTDRSHATTLLMVMILGAAVLLGGLLCCVRARAYYDQSLEAAVAQARISSETQSQTLIVVSPDGTSRHRTFGPDCVFATSPCAPIFQFRSPIGLPSYEEAIETTTQDWKPCSLAPPSYSDAVVESQSEEQSSERAATEAQRPSDECESVCESVCAQIDTPNTSEIVNDDLCSSRE